MAENEVKPIEIPVTANTTKAEKELKRLFEAVEKQREINLSYKSTTANLKKLSDVIEGLQKRLDFLDSNSRRTKKSDLFGGFTERVAIQKSLNEFLKLQNSLSSDLTNHYIAEGKRLSELINAKKQNVKVATQTATAENKVTKEIEKNTIALAQNTAEVEKNEDANEEDAKQLTIFSRIWKDLTTNLSKRIAIYASYKTINAITHSLTDAGRAVVNLQSEFANIQAITAATDGSMKSLENTILRVGNNSKFSSEELAKTTVTLGQAGYSASEIEKLLESVSQLAAATGTDLATSVSVATSALTVWNLEASQMSRVADVLTTSVNKTKAEIGTIANGIQYAGAMFSDLGVSLEESVALFSAVTNAGLKARSVVGTGSRALVTELITPSKKLEDVLKRLNLTLEEIDVRSLGITKVLENLRDAGFSSEEAFEALDRRAATFYSAASSQIDTIKQLNREFLVQGSTAKANQTQMNTLTAQIQRFRNIVVETTKDALDPFLKTFTYIFKLFNDFMSNGSVKFIITVVAEMGLAFRSLDLIKNISKLNLLNTTLTKTSGVVSKLKNDFVEFSKSVSKAGTVLTSFDKILLKLRFSLRLVGVFLKQFLLPLLAVEGLFWVIEQFGSIDKKLEDSENKINEYGTTINSLSEAYEDLINKQDLYKNDSEALYWKIAQLNEQFSKENNLLLTQVNTYDELLSKIREVQYLKEREEAEQLKKNAELRRDKITPNFKLFQPFSSRDIRTPNGILSKLLGVDLSDLKEFRKVEKTAGGWQGLLFDTIVNSTDERVKELHKLIMEHGDVEQKEELLNIYNEASKAKLDLAKSSTLFTSSMIGLDEELSKNIDGIRKTVDDSVSKYKEERKTLLNADVIDIEKSLDISSAFKDSLREQLDVINELKENAFKADPDLRKIPNEYIKTLNGLQLHIQKLLNDTTKEFDDSIVEYVNKALSRAEQALKDTLKKASLGFYGASSSDVIKKALSEYEKLLKEDTDIKVSKVKSEDAFGKSEIESVKTAASAALEAARAETTTVLDKLSDKFSKLRNQINSLKNEYKDIDSNAASSKTAVANRLGLASQRGVVSGMESMGYSALEIEREQIKLQRLENEYNKESLRIEENSLILLSRKKHQVDGLVDKLKEEVKDLTEKEALYQSDEAHYRDWEDASKKLQQRQGELNNALSLQREISNDIITKEQEIYELKEKQAVIDSRGGLTEIEAGKKLGVKGGIKSYIEEYENSMKDFNETARFTESAIDSFTSEFTNFTQSIFNGSESVKESFKSMASSILKTLSDLIIEMTIKAAIVSALNKLMGFGVSSDTSDLGDINGMAGVDYSRVAQGGPVNGPVQNRDSVPALLMPGEYVLKKSTAKALGSDFLNSLNNNASQALSSLSGGTIIQQSEPSVVNVWVVSEKEQAQIGPNDIIATITKDIRTGGTTKKLIQSVMAGRRA